jgi:hypothetical protein
MIILIDWEERMIQHKLDTELALPKAVPKVNWL